MGLRERLQWNGTQGALHDGPRRYLMLRPDVLMGALARLDGPVLAAVLDALAASAREHGADSLRAYASAVDGDACALVDATIAAAADLGWGRWTITRDGGTLTLAVDHSPFAAGWPSAANGAAARPVCAPVSGIFGGLADVVLGGLTQVDECRCAAVVPGAACRFIARLAP